MADKIAESMNHSFVGAEHMLLALLSEEQVGVRGHISKAGHDADKIYEEIVSSFSGN